MSHGFAVGPVRMEQQVYCILHHERKAAKIGISRNPSRRLRQIQTGCPDVLTMIGTIPGDGALETAFHRHFAPRRLAGEWFDDADSVVRSLFMQVLWEAASE